MLEGKDKHILISRIECMNYPVVIDSRLCGREGLPRVFDMLELVDDISEFIALYIARYLLCCMRCYVVWSLAFEEILSE
jgi:hypothetical protein